MSRYWLVKQEPAAYAWTEFVRDGGTAWTGVRNFQARNNLRAMKTGDFVLYYHSVSKPSVVGIAVVVREAYPDPTAADGDWCCVDLAPVKALPIPVALASIRHERSLAGLALVRQSRLSVMPVTPKEYEHILKLGGCKKPD
jgi:predicted RNA-binding protein with PUA-like domain